MLIEVQFLKSISEETINVKDFDDSFVADFMVIQKNFESTRSMVTVLIWLVSMITLVI